MDDPLADTDCPPELSDVERLSDTGANPPEDPRQNPPDSIEIAAK